MSSILSVLETTFQDSPPERQRLETLIEEGVSELTMYPNPSDDYVVFNKHLDVIEIYDISGKRILNLNNISKNENIDISKLTSGYYIVKIISNNFSENKNLIIK